MTPNYPPKGAQKYEVIWSDPSWCVVRMTHIGDGAWRSTDDDLSPAFWEWERAVCLAADLNLDMLRPRALGTAPTAATAVGAVAWAKVARVAVVLLLLTAAAVATAWSLP